jgi:chloride channel protein, CIC family
MGALFAATCRLPLTAIVLVLEIPRSTRVALAVVGSCLIASLTAQWLGATPLYEVLLQRLRVARRAEKAAAPTS